MSLWVAAINVPSCVGEVDSGTLHIYTHTWLFAA